MKRAIVIGAGISGLAAAWELRKAGVSVRILETGNDVGGVIRTEFKDGFLVEKGPSEMLVKSQEVLEMLQEYGLGRQIVESNPEARKRYIVRKGRPVSVPLSPREGIRSPLFSVGGKLRLVAEPLIPRSNLEDESVASFVSRRVGSEFLDYAVGPLTSGVFAGAPEQLSMRHAFPKIWNLERRFGGLIRGAAGLARERKRSGIPAWKNRLITFAGGMQVLPRMLGSQLEDCLELNCTITSIQESPWRVRYTCWVGDEREEEVDAVVLALPAHSFARLPLPKEVQSSVADLSKVRYAPVSTVAMGFRREDVAHPLDGFGMLVPKREHRLILGSLFLSTLFPGRAPEGHVNLMTFVGGATAPERAALPEAEIIGMVRGELEALLGVRAAPVLAQHHFWPAAIPQYHVGYQSVLDQLEGAEKRWPGLTFVGNYRGGPGVGDCLLSARRSIERLLDSATVASPSPSSPVQRSL